MHILQLAFAGIGTGLFLWGALEILVLSPTFNTPDERAASRKRGFWLAGIGIILVVLVPIIGFWLDPYMLYPKKVN